MYFFFSHLSLCDIIISTNIAPNTLQVILLGRSRISPLGCITQLYFFGTFAITECCLLTVMSFDRYVAICTPLHYTSIMNQKTSCYLVIWSWTAGFLSGFIFYSFLFQLQFCGSNVIDHFFCDLAPLLNLACSDTIAIQIQVSIVAIVMCFFQFLFIVVTYICILISILQISSNTGRQKVFSTCSSHLAVVCAYYGTLVALYVVPSRRYEFNINKFLSLLNTVVTPLFNPIVYSMKNKELRKISKSVLRTLFKINSSTS
ncbi:olfactory receptor 5G29-like [Rhinophrynus dorsalis]